MMKNTAPEIQDSILNIRFASSALEDNEKMLFAAQNRLRTMTTFEPDSDGVVRGHGFPEDHPTVVRQKVLVEAYADLVDGDVKALQKAMKSNPLYGWTKAQKGVGDKQIARLIALIGDPYWREVDLINEYDAPVTMRDGTVVEAGGVRYPAGPRTLRQLWAFAGLHTDENGDAVRRKKGVQANWNNSIKTRAWLVIDSCMKQISAECKTETGIGQHKDGCKCSPYRVIVDKRRLHTAITHPEWTPGHSLKDAQRIASRELLRHLYNESKRIHEGGEYTKPRTRKTLALAA